MDWGRQCLTSSGTLPTGFGRKGKSHRALEEATRKQCMVGWEAGDFLIRLTFPF